MGIHKVIVLGIGKLATIIDESKKNNPCSHRKTWDESKFCLHVDHCQNYHMGV